MENILKLYLDEIICNELDDLQKILSQFNYLVMEEICVEKENYVERNFHINTYDDKQKALVNVKSYKDLVTGFWYDKFYIDGVELDGNYQLHL